MRRLCAWTLLVVGWPLVVYAQTADQRDDVPRDDQAAAVDDQNAADSGRAGRADSADQGNQGRRSRPGSRAPRSDGRVPAARVDNVLGELNFSGADLDIQVVGDRLVITGVEEDVELLEDFIARLDAEGPQREVRVLMLENKNAQEVAGTVQQAMTDLASGREVRESEQVSLAAVSNNVLVVTGPVEKLDTVEAIVRQIDQTPIQLPPLEKMTFQLQHIKAAEAAAQLEEFIQVLRQRQGEDQGNEIRVFPVTANNSVVVIGPVTEKEKIQELIDAIDIEPAEGFGALKLAYFPVLNSDAQELADLLETLFESAQGEGEDGAAEAVRQLQMILAPPGSDEELIELPPIDLQRQIRIIADQDSKALICATSEKNIEPLGELIDLLDQQPRAEDQKLRLFALEHADADEVADLLTELFQSGEGRLSPVQGTDMRTEGIPPSAEGDALVHEIGVFAEQRTNTLLVAGRAEQLDLVESILADLDVPTPPDVRHPLRLLTLAHSDATRLGAVITDLWENRIEQMQARGVSEAAIAREQIYLSTDIRSNSLIISASEANFREIVTIVQTLDQAGQPLVDQLHIILCDNTSAADMADKIDELWKRKADLRSESELPADLPVVVADQRSNALIVAAAPEDYEEIKNLVERLEAQPLSPVAQIRLIPLRNNIATEVGDMLLSLFEERLQQRLGEGQTENPSDRVAIASDAATNTLLVASSKANYEEILGIIEAIDVESDIEGVVQLFTLQNAQAVNVAEKITELFDQELYRGAVTGEGEIVEQRQRVALIADSRSNTIVASASPLNMAIVEKLIEQFDTDQAPQLNADTRIFELEHADAVRLASILDTLFEGMGGSDDDFEAPTIVPETNSNTLLITGSRDAIKRATDLIKSLDREQSRDSMIQIYQLEHASAIKLLAKFEELFEQRQQGTDNERTPVLLQADEATNTLIASASDEDHAIIARLLSLLDVRSTIRNQVEIFPLQFADAETLSERLEQLFQSQSGGAGATRADAIAIEPDPRTNSLIVWASRSEMENVAEIIHRLDSTQPGREMMLKVIQLRQAQAEDFAEILDEALNGNESGGSGGQDVAMIISYEVEMPDGTKQVRKLLRQDVTISADPRTNSLLVKAPTGSMEMLESLIRAYDRMPTTVAELRIIPLEYADAEDIVEKLQELFEAQSGDGPQTQIAVGEGGMGGGGASSMQQALRFTADRRTNTVIAAGIESDLNMVERLVRQLDSEDTGDRIQQVYVAKNMEAPELQAAIEDFFQQENDRTSELDDETSIRRRAERQVTVVSDEDTNSLLLGVSPRYYSQTMEMVYGIDRPPPQVMIQVLIAEVTLEDRLELGMEWALQDLLFSDTAVVGPNGTVRSNEFDFVGGTDLGAVGSGLGGFTFAITGEDFNFLLRTLQTEGMLEILSRPTILVENNEEANITIGDQVPIVQGSSVSDAGQTRASVTYQDVGILLDVTPHINPDGYVNLEIAPEISNLGTSVQVSEDFSAPTISKRSADTVVTVKDGETVVIGGLIQTEDDDSEAKVPLIGDLPGVGALFRATSERRRRTELLIVLTVDVLFNEYETYDASARARDESGFLPDSIKRSPLMQGLRIRAEDDMNADPTGSFDVPPPPTVAPGYHGHRASFGGSTLHSSSNHPRQIPSAAPRYGPAVPQPRAEGYNPEAELPVYTVQPRRQTAPSRSGDSASQDAAGEGEQNVVWPNGDREGYGHYGRLK